MALQWGYAVELTKKSAHMIRPFLHYSLCELGLKHSLKYCRAPVCEVNLGLVWEEAEGDQAAA